MTLTRDQILSADDLTREAVECPEWGGTVLVRTMTGTERDAFEVACTNAEGKMTRENFRAKLAAWTVVGDDGKRLFTEADLGVLGDKSAAPLQRIFNVAMRLNRLSKEDAEELAGN